MSDPNTWYTNPDDNTMRDGEGREVGWKSTITGEIFDRNDQRVGHEQWGVEMDGQRYNVDDKGERDGR